MVRETSRQTKRFKSLRNRYLRPGSPPFNMERDEICTTCTPLDRQTPNNAIKANDSILISPHFPILGDRERFDPYPVTEPDELIVLGDDAARSCSVQYQARDLNASDL